jgi:hypothetical protein
VTPLERIVTALSDAMSRAGGLAPPILVGATLLEKVFPPARLRAGQP